MTSPRQEDIDWLAHHGVKGQKWGRRKDRTPGVSRGTERAARKDAEEFARAKMFYGKGAGTRRKLIKNQVESRAKHDPAYAKAYEKHLGLQDLGQHASKAVSERKRTDRKDTVKKSSGMLARRATGEMGTKAAFTAVALGGAAFVNSPKGRQLMAKSSRSIKNLANSRKAKNTADFLSDYFARNA